MEVRQPLERLGRRHEVVRAVESDANVEEILGFQTRLGEKACVDGHGLCLLSRLVQGRGKIGPDPNARRVTLEMSPKKRLGLGETVRKQQEFREACFGADSLLFARVELFLRKYPGDGLPLETRDGSLVSPDRVIPPTLILEKTGEIQRRVGTEVPHHFCQLPSFDGALYIPLGVRGDALVEQFDPCRLTLRRYIELISRIDPLRIGKHGVRFAVLRELCVSETCQQIMNRICRLGVDAP